MRAQVYRDTEGFWVARIEEQPDNPENRGTGAVYRRQVLPVPASATREEAEHALSLLMSREARRSNGYR